MLHLLMLLWCFFHGKNDEKHVFKHARISYNILSSCVVTIAVLFGFLFIPISKTFYNDIIYHVIFPCHLETYLHVFFNLP